MRKPTAGLELELNDITKRDVQLWCIVVLLVIVLAIGFVALVLPNILWRGGPVEMNGRYLPQLFTGFIVLIVLVSVYIAQQRHRLNEMRRTFMRRVMSSSNSDVSLFDPLTKLFNSDYLDRVLPAEVARAQLTNSAITLLAADVHGFKSINTKFGTIAGDQILLVLGQTLRKTFRGSDTICRIGGDEFLVIMPDTTESQAKAAIARLQRAVTQWNETTSLEYKLALRLGTAQYNSGADISMALSYAAYAVGANIAPILERVKRAVAEQMPDDKKAEHSIMSLATNVPTTQGSSANCCSPDYS